METSKQPRRWGRLLWRVIRLPLIAYLAVVLIMSLLESRLVYPAPPASEGFWQLDADHENAWIETPPLSGTGEATLVHGWFFPNPGAEHAVLYCHGNGDDVSSLRGVARKLRDELNAEVLVWDYRGYGKSVGHPTEAGLIADGLAAQRWLAERTSRQPDEVIVIGRSLGGGVATALAVELSAEALILQSTYTSLPDVAVVKYPWLPVRLIMRNRFDSLSRIGQYEGPVLVSHGTADEVIPFRQGVRLHEAARGPKQFHEMPGKTHMQAQPQDYYRVLRAFIAAKCNPPLVGVEPTGD